MRFYLRLLPHASVQERKASQYHEQSMWRCGSRLIGGLVAAAITLAALSAPAQTGPQGGAARPAGPSLPEVGPRVGVSPRAELGVDGFDSTLATGFELVYNLDFAAANATFQRAVAARPNYPAGYRAVAGAAWLQILFERGASLLDSYLAGSMSGPSGEFDAPREELARTFEQHVAHAIRLAEGLVERDALDPDGHYELGVAVALDASYHATILRQPFRALRSARRAYLAHERVLELDPAYHDAKMLVGLYRYIISVIPRPVRWMAYLVGFDGGKPEAIRLLADAARRSTRVRGEAQFALAMIYNREREFRRAHAVLTNLRRNFPRNRLLWIETASTWLRDGRPALAELILAHGFRRLESDPRPRMMGEEAIWRLKRGTALIGLDEVDRARPDLALAARNGAATWVRGRAHLELGKLNDLAGDHQTARGHYVRARQICNEAGDRGCARWADWYREYTYRGLR